MKVLTHFPKLKSLDLHRYDDGVQQITNKCLVEIGQLTELEHLSLSGKINNEGVPQLAALRKLKHLIILDTKITAKGLESLENPNIESLTLKSHQLGQLPDGVANLKKLKKLKYITVIEKFITEDEMKDYQNALPGIIFHWMG